MWGGGVLCGWVGGGAAIQDGEILLSPLWRRYGEVCALSISHPNFATPSHVQKRYCVARDVYLVLLSNICLVGRVISDFSFCARVTQSVRAWQISGRDDGLRATRRMTCCYLPILLKRHPLESHQWYPFYKNDTLKISPPPTTPPPWGALGKPD